MRTLSEVETEFTQLCAQIGSIEVTKTIFLTNADKKLAPLHERVAELQAEAQQIKAVQNELAKAQPPVVVLDSSPAEQVAIQEPNVVQEKS